MILSIAAIDESNRQTYCQTGSNTVIRFPRNAVWAVAASILLTGCSDRTPEPEAAGQPDIARWREDVRQLASDAFGGRAPSSEGERLTVEYLVKSFRDAGLVGGNDGSFVQEVPLVALTGTVTEPLRVDTEDASLTFATGDEAVVRTKRIVEQELLSQSPLVFVGYGVVAPEYGWDDYAGLDVQGKTVVMLVNDPGFATGDAAQFTGRAMT